MIRLPKNYRRCSGCPLPAQALMNTNDFAAAVNMEIRLLNVVCKALGYPVVDLWPARDQCLFCPHYGPNRRQILAAKSAVKKKLLDNLSKTKDAKKDVK